MAGLGNKLARESSTFGQYVSRLQVQERLKYHGWKHDTKKDMWQDPQSNAWFTFEDADVVDKNRARQ